MTDNVAQFQAQAAVLDAADTLASKRDAFSLPDNTVYLDGNSLGPLTQEAKARAKDVVERQWGQDLITSWNSHDWIHLPTIVGEKIAPLIGAAPEQVIACDSISVNLYKLLNAALRLQADRDVVLTTADNFPTDRYMVEGLNASIGERAITLRSVEESAILDSIDERVAVVMLTQVNFKTGNRLDMQAITEKAHQFGCLVIWDLAHSAGVLDVQLDACNVDFAVGCGYKYLNGGPGAPAFVYVAQRHQANYRQPLQGWMGHAAPFSFAPDYQAPTTIKQNLVGTPPVLSMSVLDASLAVFADVQMLDIEHKAIGLTQFFVDGLDAYDLKTCFHGVSAVGHGQSGAQVGLCHPDAYAICQALISEGVIVDFRAPDILRLGFSPLFLRYVDVATAIEKLADVMQLQRYQAAEFQVKQAVT